MNLIGLVRKQSGTVAKPFLEKKSGDPRWIRTHMLVYAQKPELSHRILSSKSGETNSDSRFRQINLKTFKDNKRHMVVRKKSGISGSFLVSKTPSNPDHNQLSSAQNITFLSAAINENFMGEAMARINLEDQFWMDVMEVATKMGSVDLAVGNAVRFLRHAQEMHKNDRLISEQDFADRGFSEYLFPIFAKRIEGGIMATGSDKHFGWLRARAAAGKKGGHKSAENRTKLTVKQAEAKSSKQDQAEPSSSYSPSSSESNSPSNSAKNQAQPDGFVEFYALYPRKIGKTGAEKAYKREIKVGASHEEIIGALNRYRMHLLANMTEDKYVMHASTFMNKWRDWSDPDAGKSETFNAKSDITKKISEAITKFGYTGGEGAKKFIGSVGWELVKKLGGWSQVCRLPANKFNEVVGG